MNDIWSGFMKAYTLTLFENMKHSVWCNKSSDYKTIKTEWFNKKYYPTHYLWNSKAMQDIWLSKTIESSILATFDTIDG